MDEDDSDVGDSDTNSDGETLVDVPPVFKTSDLRQPPVIEAPTRPINEGPSRSRVPLSGNDLSAITASLRSAGWGNHKICRCFGSYNGLRQLQAEYGRQVHACIALLHEGRPYSALTVQSKDKRRVVTKIRNSLDVRRSVHGGTYKITIPKDPPKTTSLDLSRKNMKGHLLNAWTAQRDTEGQLEEKLLPFVIANRSFLPELWRCTFMGAH